MVPGWVANKIRLGRLHEVGDGLERIAHASGSVAWRRSWETGVEGDLRTCVVSVDAHAPPLLDMLPPTRWPESE